MTTILTATCTFYMSKYVQLTLLNMRASMKLNRTHFTIQGSCRRGGHRPQEDHDRSKRLQPPTDRGVPREQKQGRWTARWQALAPAHDYRCQEWPTPHDTDDVHPGWRLPS